MTSELFTESATLDPETHVGADLLVITARAKRPGLEVWKLFSPAGFQTQGQSRSLRSSLTAFEHDDPLTRSADCVAQVMRTWAYVAHRDNVNS
ncbi:hypothetical protein [Nocardia goodfellowii]|uniref:Uncharacterized protein n=1 Tax=Nocardia goodfellowii TaxID=882446 RepID=A0ABS4QN72_9NOCA|nr:hypothetical protein [Nocardia goodfellowii]MBP2192988.1 hypothetical protein [Nocardia goodfellowii]